MHRSPQVAGRSPHVVSLSLLCAVWLGAAAAAPAKSPEDILNAVDDLYRGKSSSGQMSMAVSTEHWRRELTMEFWTQGEDKSLVRILAPKKESGTATLRSDKDIWNYLPKVKRVIKVPSSMMGGSWMGSHFTNDDLVRQSRMARDYTFQITFEGVRDGLSITEITCSPREDAPVVWGKVVVEVLSSTNAPVRMRYFDEDLRLSRTLTFSDTKVLDGRAVPTVMRMVPEDKPDEYTEVRYVSIDFDVDIPDATFSLRQLQR